VLSWQCLPFFELPNESLYAILKARQEVFIVEQNCPFLDADDVDQHCWHLMGWDVRHSPAVLVAYSRLVPPGIKYVEPSIGRVITATARRRQGFGRELMRRAIAKMEELYPNRPIRIGAQQYLEPFYGRFGFKTVSKPYIEDGIPHVEMLRNWCHTE
jgi:ElaA protein